MNIESLLSHIRHRLPAQAPIKDFIHHNTLHAFQHLNFSDGVEKGARFYGANAYMPLAFYRHAFVSKQVSARELNEAVQRSLLAKQLPTSVIDHALFHYRDVKDAAAFGHLKGSRAIAGKLAELLRKSQPSTPKVRAQCDSAINPTIIRLISGYLDQGLVLWPLPASDATFWECVRHLVQDSALPLASFVQKKRALKWLSRSAEEAIEELLHKIVVEPGLFEAYVEETLMAHPGWSGMVNVVEQKPAALLRRRAMRLVDFLAVKLVLESELIDSNAQVFSPNPRWIQDEVQQHAMSLALWLDTLEKENAPSLESVLGVSPMSLSAIWQEAYEATYYRQVLSGLKQHANSDRSSVALQPASSAGQAPLLQASFCIDDRESSFRRYLEELDPRIETFATAGFYGIDVYFQSLNDAEPFQSCPVVISPKYVLKELPEDGHHEHFDVQKQNRAKAASTFWRNQNASSSMLLGFIAANTLGHLSIFKLLSLMLRPLSFARSLQARKIEIKTKLTLLREHETPEGELHLGFTYEEMANRVDAVLRNMGLTENFAPLVFLIAHGSSSVNNPHFSAYDCGACSGKPGAPNSRAFAQMANLAEVRGRVAAKGIVIPDTTRFIGAFHDTCVDEISFADLDGLSEEQQRVLSSFQATIEQARRLNAKERCRRFAVVNLDATPEQALSEVQQRAHSLFEPRPELNHATNTLAIVGRRSLTRGLFLDRRAFLNSYDPLLDQSGQILNAILNAVVPVCGGINLEYYFSRLDPGIYGCGTKLSHNVCSLIGVYNGIDDDLRTGLPIQMTEVHDPIRLLIIVEQTPEIVHKVITHNLPVLEWIDNAWVHVACIHPETKEVSLYKPKQGFEPFQVDADVLTFVRSSSEHVSSSRENLAIAQVGVR